MSGTENIGVRSIFSLGGGGGVGWEEGTSERCQKWGGGGGGVIKESFEKYLKVRGG